MADHQAGRCHFVFGVTMDGRKKKRWLLSTAAVLRLLLCWLFPGLPDLMTSRVEVSTPITSFKRLQEGVHLYKQGYSPYDGGVYHQAPVLLPIFRFLPSARNNSLWTVLVSILADILSANALMEISRSGENIVSKQFTSLRKHLRWTSTSVGAAYLFNPFTIAASLGRSTGVFTNCTILYAVATASLGNPLLSAVFLGLASYLSLYPILLTPPLMLMAYNNQSKRTKDVLGPSAFSSYFLSCLVTSICVLLGGSWMQDGCSWRFLASTYGIHLAFADLTPNIGLWWYFFIEMFDSFREFFLGVFWIHMASYVGGMTIKLWRQPLFVITSLIGVLAILKPYPSIADVSLYFALVPLYRHLFPLLRYGFVAAAAILYATFLGPAFFHLWVYAGSGNANFFYAITLVWSLGLILIVADFIFAALRDEFEVERPEMQGKDIRQI